MNRETINNNQTQVQTLKYNVEFLFEWVHVKKITAIKISIQSGISMPAYLLYHQLKIHTKLILAV